MNFAEERTFAASASESLAGSVSVGSASTPRPAAPPIAERLRTARIAAHLTQQELAEGLYSTSYLSAIERGKIIPSLQALGKLAERLALPVSFFLGESEATPEGLEESSTAGASTPDLTGQAEVADAMLRLSKAEAFMRKDQARKALEALGGSEEPLAGLPIEQRPFWYWLAGWASGLERRNAEAIRLLERGLHLAESLHLRAPLPEKAHLAEVAERLRCYLGFAYCAEDKAEEALHQHLRGLEAIDKHIVTDVELKMLIYKGLGHEYLALSYYHESASYYQLALKHAQDRTDHRQQGSIAWGLGMAQQAQGDLLAARKNYEEALEALGQHGNPMLLAQVHALLGQALVKLGIYAEAEPHLHKSLASAREKGDRRTAGIALVNFAALYLARGDLDRAVETGQEAAKLSEQSKDQRNSAQVQLTLAAAYAARHESGAAEQAHQKSIQIAEQIPDHNLLRQAHQHFADFLAAEGRFQEAYVEIQRVSSAFPNEPEAPEHCTTLESGTQTPRT